jgi:hypothetical protein
MRKSGHGKAGVPPAQAAVEFDPVSRGVCAELQAPCQDRATASTGQGRCRQALGTDFENQVRRLLDDCELPFEEG